MAESPAPRLRPLELKWIEDNGQRMLFVRDPTGIAPYPATVPAAIAYLMSFFDGERDAAAISAAYELRTGQRLPPVEIQRIVNELDEALFLESERFQAARDELIRAYRDAAYRPPALADRVYPGRPSELARQLDGYRGESLDGAASSDGIRGIVSPHIDYQRGGPVYAETWRRAADAVQAADVVVIFGTDHSGGPGKITLTRQSYATPYGILPTDANVVDALAEAIGHDAAYDEELHHRNEHSIELAAVWLHHTRIGTPPPVVPVLCGSFYSFTDGESDPASNETIDRAITTLREATAGRRVLAVAAADLAHVGPAFGDQTPYGADDKAELRRKDEEMLRAVCSGSASEFFGLLRAERDCRRVCGLPPIYLMLRYLGPSAGEVVQYDQCPADANGGSVVSIAGVLVR